MGFLEIKTDNIEGPPPADPYAEQQQLLGLLEAAHAHNAEILHRYGYRCPDHPGGLRTASDMAEADAIEAAHIIDAIGNVWRAWFGNDKAAIGNAGIWLGVVLGAEQFRQHQRRSRQGARAPHSIEREKRARAIYDRMRRNGDEINWKTFYWALRDAGIAGGTESVARRLLTELKRT